MNDLRGRFLRLSAVNVLAHLTVPLAGLVDTAMLGHLDDIRFLAGVALASVVFDYVYWTFGFLRMGTTGTTAQAWGRGDVDEQWTWLYRGLAVALALGLLLLVAQWLLRESAFALLAGAPGVESAGRDYFDARIWGAPATLCGFVLIGWLLGLGESRLVLVMVFIANSVNVSLDWLFIVRLDLAARGAGLATMFSQYALVSVGAGLVLRRHDLRRPDFAAVFDRAGLTTMIRLNRDIAIRTLCLVSAFAVFTNFSSLLGTTILAANSILLRLQTLAAYVIDGLAFAAETLAGRLRGRADRPGLRRLFRLSLVAGSGVSVVFLGALFVAPKSAIGLLTSHEGIAETAVRFLIWQIPVLTLGAIAYMLDGLFLGMTAGRALRDAMLVSTVAVFAPLAAFAVALGSNHLLWLAMAGFMGARTLTLALASRPLLRCVAPE